MFKHICIYIYSINILCMHIFVFKILSTGVITVKFVKEAMYERLVENFSKQFTRMAKFSAMSVSRCNSQPKVWG